MNGFGLESSDVDMCLLVRHEKVDSRDTALLHLNQTLKCLQRYSMYKFTNFEPFIQSLHL